MEGMDLARKKEEELGAAERSEAAPSRDEGALGGRNLSVPDPEVSERPVRRRFTTEYKLRILEEADACNKTGEMGALLRREGLYSSSLATWRRQRREGTLAGLSPKKRGRKGDDEATREIKRLRRENERLRRQLEQAKTVIEVQKKLSDVLGITMPQTDPIEED
jgi:transposase-like protein